MTRKQERFVDSHGLKPLRRGLKKPFGLKKHLNGVRFSLSFRLRKFIEQYAASKTSNGGSPDDGCDGVTDGPRTKPHPKIYIADDLHPFRELVVLLHEMRHARQWELDHEFVESDGEEVGSVLWTLGYRRLPQKLAELPTQELYDHLHKLAESLEN